MDTWICKIYLLDLDRIFLEGEDFIIFNHEIWCLKFGLIDVEFVLDKFQMVKGVCE